MSDNTKLTTAADHWDVARYWFGNVFRPYPTIEEVRTWAFLSLCANESITTYTFDGGVEQRRSANPVHRFNQAMTAVSDWFADVASKVKDMNFG